MIRRRLLAVGALAAMLLTGPALSQGNDDDYTPLNSRIRRDRQFPLEPQTLYEARELSRVERTRSRSMVGQFARCMWSRSNEDSLAFLARTDFGFVNFAQIGMTREQVNDNFPIETCLDRVASSNSSGVQLRYTDEGIRRWLLEQAYLAAYPAGPTWVQPGYVIGARTYPLSANRPPIHAAMNFADCVVAANPTDSDYLFRTGDSSAEETATIQRLVPAISACMPQGQQMEIEPLALRVWLGEGLWHAANNSAPAPEEAQ